MSRKRKKKKSLFILFKKSRKVSALFSSRLKSLNFVSLRLNSEVFKAAQSKLSHILTIPINTSVERIGVGQACDSKRLQTTGRRSAKHTCRMVCASVVYHYECSQTFCRCALLYCLYFCSFSSVCCICVCIVLSISGG